MRPGASRTGGILVEAIVTLLLLVLLVSTAWKTLAGHRQLVIDLAHRADGLETVRTLAWILGEEVSEGRPGSDWEVVETDSLSLRAFRGMGLIESGARVGRTVTVCFRGFRSPAPEKDSLLMLGGDGRWTAVDLEHRTRIGSDCSGAAGWWREEWTVSRASPDAVLARLFERGSYHLTDGALRYRRGLGGRQPLTAEVIETGSFISRSRPGDPFGWEITLRSQGRGSTPRPNGPVSTLPWRGGVW
ncbi:MAG: hypothetical protein HKO65_12150 [Gemmatimonadetes bacterium]|nr:hypothetical protein [Gemmatimonadota bacterium]